ncbi:MAG: class I SAM-dependent RNA methyltransferase, partial [Microbacterium sp.]
RVRVLPRPDARRSGRARRPRDDAAREVVVERARGRDFRVAAGGFWQVHRLAADTLAGLVVERVRAVAPHGQTAAVDPDAWHLDLYGGVGLFAAALGELGGPSTRVTSVESDPRATAHARENLAEWAGARAETARVDRWLAALPERATRADRERLRRGVVVLDPPRSGAGAAVSSAIAALQPAAVVYVACDPVALARDLAAFRAAGYQPRSIDAVDLFPNSHHLEAVALLVRDAP